MKSKGSYYNCGSTVQLWHTKAETDTATSAIAGSAALQPAITVTNVVIPQSLHPSLTYSHFIYPHSQNSWFTQILCLWASFQGNSVETTWRLSRLSLETCSRLLAQKPSEPMFFVGKQNKTNKQKPQTNNQQKNPHTQKTNQQKIPQTKSNHHKQTTGKAWD